MDIYECIALAEGTHYYFGFTPNEVGALLAWLPQHDEPANTWERNIGSIRRKLERAVT